MKNIPKVLVFFIHYKNLDDTLETLKSAGELDYPNFSITVLDNGSTASSAVALKRSPVEFNLVTSEKNLGFAGGFNFGVRHSPDDYDYVFFINNDVTLEPDCLRVLVEAAETDEKIGLLSPRINYYFDKKRIWYNGGLIKMLQTKGVHRDLDKKEEELKESFVPEETGFAAGCAVLIKKKVLEKIGWWSEDYFLYHEDVDFSLRAKRAGFKVMLVPRAKIYHKISRATEPGSPKYIYYHSRNGLVVAWKMGSGWQKFALIVFSVLRLFKQLPKFLIPGKAMWAKAIIKGTFDFYQGKRGEMTNNF